jgi:hypothetical protein
MNVFARACKHEPADSSTPLTMKPYIHFSIIVPPSLDLLTTSLCKTTIYKWQQCTAKDIWFNRIVVGSADEIQ